MSEKRYYVVGVIDPAVWNQVHAALTQDGSTDTTIPARAVECTDTMDHSPTRAVYLLTDKEAQQVSACTDVKFVDLDKSKYPDLFPPTPDELHCNTRYTSTVKNYKNFSGLLPQSPTSADANRAGYQLLRCVQYDNPWNGVPVSTVIDSAIPRRNTGKNVDVIVGDDGCWFGHVEFQNNPTGGVELPADYVGGNLLPGNGTCDLLDVVLEGPYYIDPDWFNADPGTRLTTRWDGTTVPVEDVARTWWSNASQRSVAFAGAGTVAVPGTYTRANCNGTNTSISGEGNHGTACAGQAYGRTAGWAYNANKWFIDAYGSFGFGINVDLYFDVVKIFHLNKPINPLYGTKDPTINSNSWGFRATIPSSGFYYFRQGTSGAGGVAYTGTKPRFMASLGSTGDSNRAKGEMVPNNLTTAGDELIASGVIFVAAAGNSNQQQVSSNNPNFNNYWSTTAQGGSAPLINATHDEFGSLCYNTTGRRGFPQQLGKYTDGGGNVVYPVINIGALDNDNNNIETTKEQKVNYSDMGNEIDCYAPGDGTLAPNRLYASTFPRYDKYASAITQNGYSGVCNTLFQLAALPTTPNTGNQITTANVSGINSAQVVNIPSSLLGPAGLTSSTTPTTGNNDDGYWTLSLPFFMEYCGFTFDTIYIGTNSYITFSAGSSVYSNLGPANPQLFKIMMSAADNSAQRIYYGTEGVAPNRTYRVRWEGTNATSGTLGNPNMVWEATFYEATPTQIDMQIGVNANSSGPTTFYDTSFGGTSSACPTSVGVIATVLENNRSWGWADVRTWIQSLQIQDGTTFYQGPDPQTADSIDWVFLNSLMGGTRRVLYNNVSPATTTTTTIGGAGLNIRGSGLTITFS